MAKITIKCDERELAKALNYARIEIAHFCQTYEALKDYFQNNDVDGLPFRYGSEEYEALREALGNVKIEVEKDYYGDYVVEMKATIRHAYYSYTWQRQYEGTKEVDGEFVLDAEKFLGILNEKYELAKKRLERLYFLESEPEYYIEKIAEVCEQSKRKDLDEKLFELYPELRIETTNPNGKIIDIAKVVSNLKSY